MNTAPEFQNTTIKVNFSHNISSNKLLEIRLDLYQTIASVKNVVEKRYGSNASSVDLQLQDKEGNGIAYMNDDNKTLADHGVQEGYNIYVIDLNPHSQLKEFEDLSKVKKYEISDEDYDKLPGSFRKFKQQFLSNNPAIQPTITPILDADYGKEQAEQIKVGDRCKLLEKDHRGEVKYVGKVPNMGQGYFIGIQLDEPYGTCDGSFFNVPYFQCPNKYGLFVRPDKVEVGDFPELEMEDEI